jgi:hypothetical protein
MECFSIVPLIAICIILAGLSAFGFMYFPVKSNPEYFPKSFRDIHRKIRRRNAEGTAYAVCYPAIIFVLVPMGWPIRVFVSPVSVVIFAAWGQSAVCS